MVKAIGSGPSLVLISRGDALSYTKVERLKKELDRAISEGDFELALEAVEDMIGFEPENDQFWNSKGVILAKIERIEESVEAFDMALEIDPDAARTWYSKGVILMENGSNRPALACFYKALDLDPVYQKARERFIRCLDDLILLKQAQAPEDTLEQPMHDIRVSTPQEEEDEEEPKPEINEPKAKKRKGTYLDEDMFGKRSYEDDEDIDDDEDWEEMDDVGENDESWGDDDEMDSIKCRCGATIWIETDKRPYRFECEDCGRTGILK